MTRPHLTKASVNLASNPASGLKSSAPRPSRIRRDPPPTPATTKELFVDAEEREQWAVIVGVVAFALAIFVIVIAFGVYSSWSPSEYTVEMRGD
ncbi:MAG: hypothetical protein ABIN68_01205 [Sphingomicrobium sp.]